MYLPRDGLFPGDTGTVRGRNATSTWLYLNLDKDNAFCWAAASVLKVTGDIKTVKIAPINLPITRESPLPTGVVATRKGNKVTIIWDPLPVTARDYRGFLLNVSVCMNSIRQKLTVQTNDTTYTFTDDNNCSGTSKGQIQSVTVDGYSTPVDIAWPPY